MNLLKRSPPPPQSQQQQQQPPHSAGLDINRTAGCSIGGMGGENSAFRAVITGPTSTTVERIERIDNLARQPERKPSAFRMISQLVGETSPSSPPIPGADQRNREPGVDRGPGRPEIESIEDEDVEIDVQDSEQDTPSPSPVAWRDHWTDQQPLELTKHDR